MTATKRVMGRARKAPGPTEQPGPEHERQKHDRPGKDLQHPQESGSARGAVYGPAEAACRRVVWRSIHYIPPVYTGCLLVLEFTLERALPPAFGLCRRKDVDGGCARHAAGSAEVDSPIVRYGRRAPAPSLLTLKPRTMNAIPKVGPYARGGASRRLPEILKCERSRRVLKSSKPASLARMMAWARSATCSLVKMLET